MNKRYTCPISLFRGVAFYQIPINNSCVQKKTKINSCYCSNPLSCRRVGDRENKAIERVKTVAVLKCSICFTTGYSDASVYSIRSVPKNIF